MTINFTAHPVTEFVTVPWHYCMVLVMIEEFTDLPVIIFYFSVIFFIISSRNSSNAM